MMLKRPGRILLVTGAALIVALIVARLVAGFYTEYLWFASEGHLPVFLRRVWTGLAVQLTTGTVAAALVLLNLWLGIRHLGPVQVRRRYGNLEIAEQIPRRHILIGAAVTAVLAGWWLAVLSFGGDTALGVFAWLRQVPWGLSDPQFGRDLGFYVFSLPVLFRLVDFLILVVVWSASLVLLAYVVVGAVRWRESRIEVDDSARMHFVVLFAAVVLLVAVRYWLGRYGLLLEGSGFRGALGYTDVHARLPAHRAMTTLSVLAAGALLYGAWRRSWVPPIVAVAVLVAAAVGVGRIYPSFVQRFTVEPNQLAREEPFIAWNIEFTRLAYGLERLERRVLPYRPASVPKWEEIAPALSRLPLWDRAQLGTIYKQRQVLYAYYDFPTVEYDRYGPPGAAQQVAVAVREFNVQGVADEARTWQTLRLEPTYMRGEGVVVTPVAQHALSQPPLWVGNLPVEHHRDAPADLLLDRPAIYFGQGTRDYVILVPQRDTSFRAAPGQDSPAGIPLSSFPRLLALAWRFTDKNLIFSAEITRDSRLVYRRSVRERVEAIAPFVTWGAEAYPVVYGGRVVWVLEGYTASSNFPLARALEVPRIGRVRYLRNSVKATVDAVSGRVTIYAVDPEEPILRTYARIFPELIRPLDEMPAELQRHLRYPAEYLAVQAEVLKEYHLDGAAAFYAGQDYWQVPEEAPAVLTNTGAVVAPARPFAAEYAMMRLPGEERPEFLLALPFTARERQNMTAMLIARSDAPHYGELVLLELPRDQQISGPGQVDALIEQDPVIAQQFGFWQRQATEVERGRMRIVPLDSGFLYVRPIYLKAQANPIPDLVGVVASDGRRVALTHTPASLADAVASLDEPSREAIESSPELIDAVEWPRRAAELLDEADARLRSGDFAGFGARLQELRALLERISSGIP